MNTLEVRTDMNFKTILLGSAAALAVTGAQAADLSIAEPVDYVRVCDAFGSGYWYIPNTDTCIKLGGRARFEILLHEEKVVGGDVTYVTYSSVYGSVYVSSTSAFAPVSFSTDYYSTATFDNRHSASWQFVSSGILKTTVKSMTEYGVLTGYTELTYKSDNDDANTDDVRLAHVYLELGHVLMGHTDSTFNYGGVFNFDSSNHGNTETDLIRLSWAMHGFGLELGLEDPRDRWSTSIGDYGMPDIVGAITMDQGHWDAKLSAGYADGSDGSAWAVQLGATFKLDSIAAGDKLRLKVGYGDTTGGVANSFIGAGGSGESWLFNASFQHYWSSTLSSAISYSFNDEGAAADTTNVSLNLVWAPVTGFSAGIEALYTDVGGSDAWTGKARIQRTW